MLNIQYSCVAALLLAVFTTTDAAAASLYTTKCGSLTGAVVDDPADVVTGVQVVARVGLPPAHDTQRREHVQISAGLAAALGITATDVSLTGVSPQMRVSLGSGSPLPTANMTVAAIDAADPGLRLAVWLPEGLTDTGTFTDLDNGFLKLFGLQSPTAVFATTRTATVHGMAPATTVVIEDLEASKHAHFVEPNASSSKQFRECVELRDDDRLAVLVPHGGGIETKIDDELDTLLGELEAGQIEPSVWTTAGQWGDTTFERWHITATQISELAFPGYAALAAAAVYDYSVALHGFRRSERAVVLGGQASRQIKCHLLATIEDHLHDSQLSGKITYKIFAPDGPPIDVLRASTGESDKPKALTDVDDLDGSSSSNVVNRVSANGIQLEMSTGLRGDTALFHEFMRGLARGLEERIELEPGADHCAAYE